MKFSVFLGLNSGYPNSNKGLAAEYFVHYEMT